MEKMTDFVFNFPVDETTVDSIQSLRNIRLGLARKMLDSVPQTVDEMIRRNILVEGDREKYVRALKSELYDKISHLQKRGSEEASIYSDELELYLGLLREPEEEVIEKP